MILTIIFYLCNYGTIILGDPEIYIIRDVWPEYWCTRGRIWSGSSPLLNQVVYNPKNYLVSHWLICVKSFETDLSLVECLLFWGYFQYRLSWDLRPKKEYSGQKNLA